ncbi:DUF5777 family beta-barrel protein [Aquimarina sp. M1]
MPITIFSTDHFLYRTAFTSLVLIASKFTPQFSLQLSPTSILRGFSVFDEDSHNHFSLDVRTRYKEIYLLSQNTII